MEPRDFARECRDLYTATRKVKEVVAGPGVFLAAEGQGTPGGEAFVAAISALYPVIYTLKYARREAGRADYRVGKMECVYLSDPHAAPMEEWRWRLLFRVPEDVTEEEVAGVRAVLRERKGIDVSCVRVRPWEEGRALQVLHVGPYTRLGESYALLGEHARSVGLAVKGPAHEIYLSDPRRTAPERLKTIVRLSVAPV